MSLSDLVYGNTEKKDNQTIRNELSLILSDLIKVDNRIKVIVFGSVARRLATIQSDYDLAVIVDDAIRLKEFRHQFYFQRQKVKFPVDFIFRSQSQFEQKKESNPIDNEIAETGIEIYPHWNLND